MAEVKILLRFYFELSFLFLILNLLLSLQQSLTHSTTQRSRDIFLSGEQACTL